MNVVLIGRILRRRVLPLLAAVLMLAGCIPAALVTGATVGGLVIHDRRSTGMQTDDESREWKAIQLIPQRYLDSSHLNFTSYNGRLLITGEALDAASRDGIAQALSGLDGVREIVNEVRVAPLSSLAQRSKDSFITSQVKGRLVDSKKVSANHVKVVTEAAVVYLFGIVNQQEADAAIHVARIVSGVAKVVSLFTVVNVGETKRLDNRVRGDDANQAPTIVDTATQP